MISSPDKKEYLIEDLKRWKSWSGISFLSSFFLNFFDSRSRIAQFNPGKEFSRSQGVLKVARSKVRSAESGVS